MKTPARTKAAKMLKSAKAMKVPIQDTVATPAAYKKTVGKKREIRTMGKGR